MLMKTPKACLKLLLDAKLVPANEFDSAVAQFDGVVQEMTVAFAQSRWPSVTLEPWIYSYNGLPAAAVLVMVQPMPMRLGRIAVVKWGPILANDQIDHPAEVYEAAVSHLAEEYAKRRGIMISVMARAEPVKPPICYSSLLACGFQPGSGFPHPERYFVKVRLSDEEQRKSFAQKWRYHLNKSEKQGLQFEVAEGSELPRFQKLYQCMTARKKFPDYSAFQTLPQLLASYPEALKPKFFFVTKDGADVAGAVIFTAGRTAIYLYGATTEQALPLRAGYLMHARIIAWLRDNTRAEWYDLGGSDGFQGLHQFKKGMVGIAGAITVTPPMAHFAVGRKAWAMGLAAHKARDMATAAKLIFNRARGHQAKPDLKPDVDRSA